MTIITHHRVYIGEKFWSIPCWKHILIIAGKHNLSFLQIHHKCQLGLWWWCTSYHLLHKETEFIWCFFLDLQDTNHMVTSFSYKHCKWLGIDEMFVSLYTLLSILLQVCFFLARNGWIRWCNYYCSNFQSSLHCQH